MFLFLMLVLRHDEVNLGKILERFEEVKSDINEIDVGYPDIGRDWTFRDGNQVFPQDWKAITQKILSNYAKKDYDLILVSKPHRKDVIIDRILICSTEAYKLK